MSRGRKTPFTVGEAAYRRNLTRLVREGLAEDIGTGDRTTQALALGRKAGQARIVARQAGVLAGQDTVTAVFAGCSRSVRIIWRKRDRASFKRGETIAVISGPAAAILTGERTALNFLSHLSGVATATRRLVDLLPGPQVRLLDTRKTTPGWRMLEKRATAVGGALNHRLGLYDALMLKDNHIAACGGLQSALERAIKRAGSHPLISEVQNLRELKIAVTHGVHWVLLDNFSVQQLQRAVEFRKTTGLGRKLILEASGNITARTIHRVASTGVDFISSGAITHSAPAIDFSLDWNG